VKASCNWVIRLDGRVYPVRATWPDTDAVLSVYVDGVLTYQKSVLLTYPRELCRFQLDGHEYIVRMKGWTLKWATLQLQVDGIEAERTNDGPLAAPTSGGKTGIPQEQRVELVETRRIEESLGEDRRVIDNTNSSAEVRRTITVSREWSQTIAIDDETTTSVKGEASVKLKAIFNLKLEAERRIREKYTTSTETKRKCSDEVVITVPARTKIELVFAWKQVWQCGIIRAHAHDGSTVELPYRLCLEPTFDQKQVESPA